MQVVIKFSIVTSLARIVNALYHDAMAIVGQLGMPNFFITMTCNPYWAEIQRNLLHGQQYTDRPDLVAHVFNLKLKAVLKLLIKDAYFVEVEGKVYTIEFQSVVCLMFLSF